MARTRKQAETAQSLSPAEGARQLREQIDRGKTLLESGAISSQQEQGWKTTTQHILTQAFGSQSNCVRDVMSVNQYAFVLGGGTPEQWATQRVIDMKARVEIMEGLAAMLESQANPEPMGRQAGPESPELETAASDVIVLTWSGRTSHTIASLLYQWFQKVVPGLKTWISTEDIAKGDRWFPELMKQLGKTTTCVISVTPENHKAPWVYYEAGVIAAKQESGKICTVLFGVTTMSIKDTPLAQFQATEGDGDDIWRLVRSINRRLTNPNDENVVRRLFDKHWPALKAAVDDGLSHSTVPVDGGETLELPSQFELSEGAKEVLLQACKSTQGKVYWNHNQVTGRTLSANNRDFLKPNDPRDAARGQDIIDELVNAKLIEDRWHNGEVYAVTSVGYRVGDSL